MKERVTLTLDSDILSQIDGKIDGHYIKNRSHAVELMLSESLGADAPKKAIILAGAKGIHIKGIENNIPNPMIKINNKPILEHNLELLKKNGIKNILISIGYRGDVIKGYFGDGSKMGVSINYSEQKPGYLIGTGGCLRSLNQFIDSTFILMYGDNLINIDIKDMYSFHKKNNAKATVALKAVSLDTSSYGIAKLRGDKILEFSEKKKRFTNLINAGFFIMEHDVIGIIPKKGFSKLEDDVFPQLAGKNQLFGYTFDGQWIDITDEKKIKIAENEWRGV